MQVILKPAEISCLLYYYTRTAEEVAGSNDVGIKRLLQLGLIDEEATTYKITHRGVAHVIQLMDCKVPVSMWVIEHRNEVILRPKDVI